MPEVKEINARSPKLDRDTTVMVEYGETIEETLEMFGGEAVNSNAYANWRVTLQAAIRRGHEAGKSDEEIQDMISKCKMGVAMTSGRGKADPIQQSLAKFKQMSPEEQQEYLEKLREAAAAM